MFYNLSFVSLSVQTRVNFDRQLSQTLTYNIQNNFHELSIFTE